MTHFIVSFDFGQEVSALRTLPARWVRDDHTYSVVKENTTTVNDGLLSSSCDVEISLSNNNTYFCLGASVRNSSFSKRVDFVRQKKSIQTALFNAAAQRLGLKNYRHLNCWQNAYDVTVLKHGLFLIRPENGARGIGQMVFNSREVTPVALDMIIALHCDVEKDPTSCEKQAFAEALRHRAPTAVYSTARDRTPDEGLKSLKDERCFSEYVTDVKREFRLLTGATGKVCYVLERTRQVTGNILYTDIAIGCGNGESAEDSFTALSHVGVNLFAVQRKEITAMLHELAAPLQSFDLYVTESGKWGFWETSPEFGSEAVPAYIMKEEAMKYIELLCTSINT